MGMKARNLRLSSGAMTQFRLADEEWTAIDRIAAARGLRWTEWARQVIDAHPDAPSRSALLRRVALEEAFGRALLAERAEQMQRGGDLDHPMLNGRFRTLSDGAVEAELAYMQIDYRADMIVMELIAGFHGEGAHRTPIVLVRSKLEDGISFVLTRDPIDDDEPLDPEFITDSDEVTL
jgi:predicted DNA-binding ribbon-helix-helix protein